MKVVYFAGERHVYEDGDPEYYQVITRDDAVVPGFPFESLSELPARVRSCRFCASGIATNDETTHCPSCGAPI